jgi:hypothetical protein
VARRRSARVQRWWQALLMLARLDGQGALFLGDVPFEATMELVDDARESVGVLAAVPVRNMNEVGGACSFCCLSAALLFSLGATEGALDDATAMLSRLLCPGTPSNVLVAPCFPFSSSVKLLLIITGGGPACPNRKLAARDILGAIIGAAVDATEMVEARLCPGTFANVWARRSLDTGARGVLWLFSMVRPARRAAALVIRGTMSGLSCVAGTARALNSAFPFGLVLDFPPAVDALVTLECAYPSSSPAARLWRIESSTPESMLLIEP